MCEARLYPWELAALPEYSHSLPTGTTMWKAWRRRWCGTWLIGQYIPHPDPERIGIRWFRVVLRAGPPRRRFATFRKIAT